MLLAVTRHLKADVPAAFAVGETLTHLANGTLSGPTAAFKVHVGTKDAEAGEFGTEAVCQPGNNIDLYGLTGHLEPVTG